MPFITKTTESGADIEIEHFPALMGNNTIRSQFRINQPGSPHDNRPWNAIAVDTSGPGIMILNHMPMTLDGADALKQCLEAAIIWMKEATAPEPPIEPMPDVPPVTLEPMERQFGPEGGAGSFTVTMTGPGESNSWTVDKDSEAHWITQLTPPALTQQTLDGEVTYNIAANSGMARTGHFYVNGKTHSIQQSQGDNPVQLSPVELQRPRAVFAQPDQPELERVDPKLAEREQPERKKPEHGQDKFEKGPPKSEEADRSEQPDQSEHPGTRPENKPPKIPVPVKQPQSEPDEKAGNHPRKR